MGSGPTRGLEKTHGRGQTTDNRQHTTYRRTCQHIKKIGLGADSLKKVNILLKLYGVANHRHIIQLFTGTVIQLYTPNV